METKLEWVLTNTYKAEMISYLSAHPEDFEEAIKLAISDKQPWSWRAAWLLWSCMEINDPRVQKYIKPIIDALAVTHDNQQRELLIILQQMNINEKLEGKLFNHCVTVWAKIDKKPSVRFNAFKVIIKIAQNHPELSHEIVLLAGDQYLESLSAAARKSVMKMVQKLKI